MGGLVLAALARVGLVRAASVALVPVVLVEARSDATISTELACSSSPTPALFGADSGGCSRSSVTSSPTRNFSLHRRSWRNLPDRRASRASSDIATGSRVCSSGSDHSTSVQGEGRRNFAPGINALRAAGKQVDCQLGARDLEYFVASSHVGDCAPGLDLAVDGLAANVMFFGGALEELGVKVVAERRGAFKVSAGAVHPLRDERCAGARAGGVLDTVYGNASSTGLLWASRRARADVERLISEGTCTATEAQARSFVDEVIYPDEVDAYLGEDLSGPTDSLLAGLRRSILRPRGGRRVPRWR